MKHINFAIASLGLVAGVLFADNGTDPWSHIKRTTTDGVNVSVDYIANAKIVSSTLPNGQIHTSTTVTANEVYINVYGPNLSKDDIVDVGIINYFTYESDPGATTIPYAYSLKHLSWTNDANYGDHFSGKTTDAVVTHGRESFKPSEYPVIKIFQDANDGGRVFYKQDLYISINCKGAIPAYEPDCKSETFTINLYKENSIITPN